MSDEPPNRPPKNSREGSPHEVPPRTIALIFGVMFAGLGVGMLLVLPHYGPRKPRHRSALGHVMPGSMIGRETNGMMWVPGGLFPMGSAAGKPDESPVHEATVGPVWMDKTEVTNEQFSKFIEATGYVTVAEQVKTNLATWRHPAGPDSNLAGRESHPVVQIAWPDAVAYAKWAGKRLPTEAEWEHAARGGLNQQSYPWGNEPPTAAAPRANLGLAVANPTPGTMRVGSFAPNGYGLFDMAGNVAEWCADLYDPGYYASSPKLNPKGPETAPDGHRVVRGGSFQGGADAPENCRASARSFAPPHQVRADLGFRCVKDGF